MSGPSSDLFLLSIPAGRLFASKAIAGDQARVEIVSGAKLLQAEGNEAFLGDKLANVPAIGEVGAKPSEPRVKVRPYSS